MIFDLFDTFEVICNYKIFWFYNYTCHTWHLNSLIVPNRCPCPIIFNYWTEMTLNSTLPGGTYTRLKGVKKGPSTFHASSSNFFKTPFWHFHLLRIPLTFVEIDQFLFRHFSENYRNFFEPVQGSLTSLGVKKN